MTRAPRSPPTTTSNAKLDRIVTIWSRVVQTQEHFNDICMRVRALYTTLIAAIVAAYGFLLQNSKENLSFSGISVDAVVPLALAGFLVASLFYFVDRYWYHALLLGSVDQGAEIEARWAALIPEIQLGSKISGRSPIDISDKPIRCSIARIFVSDPRLKSTKKLHSDAKIELFYKPVAALMCSIAVLALLLGGVTINRQALPVWAWQTVAGRDGPARTSSGKRDSPSKQPVNINKVGVPTNMSSE